MYPLFFIRFLKEGPPKIKLQAPKQRGTAPAPCRQRALSTSNNLSAHNTERVSRRSSIWYVRRCGLGHIRAFRYRSWRMEAETDVCELPIILLVHVLSEKPNKTFTCSKTSFVLQRAVCMIFLFRFVSVMWNNLA